MCPVACMRMGLSELGGVGDENQAGGNGEGGKGTPLLENHDGLQQTATPSNALRLLYLNTLSTTCRKHVQSTAIK